MSVGCGHNVNVSILMSEVTERNPFLTPPGHPLPKSLSHKEMGKRFATLRERVGWTQPEAAEALGLSLGNLQKGEKGERAIPEKFRAALAAKAGETLAYFLPEATPDENVRAKLLAAAMLERMAKELRAEATRPPAAKLVPSGGGRDAHDVPGSAEVGEAAEDAQRGGRRPPDAGDRTDEGDQRSA